IRDFHVTGVQTCALPIYLVTRAGEDDREDLEQPPLVVDDQDLGHPRRLSPRVAHSKRTAGSRAIGPRAPTGARCGTAARRARWRSEERRVREERRSQRAE